MSARSRGFAGCDYLGVWSTTLVGLSMPVVDQDLASKLNSATADVGR